MTFDHVEMKEKYSFQLIVDSVFGYCVFDTKGVLNVTVKNCIVKGEYLAWYSDGLTVENGKIIGTQPLCYCKYWQSIN